MSKHFTLPTITASGSSGSATGTGTSVRALSGLLLAIKIVQAGSPAASTDITITTEYGGVTRTLLTLTNNNTASAWYDVREQTDDVTGTAISANYTLIPLGGTVTVAIAQGDANQTCVATFVYE